MSDLIHICGRCCRKAAQPQYSWYDEITGFTMHFCFDCYQEWDKDWVVFIEDNC